METRVVFTPRAAQPVERLFAYIADHSGEVRAAGYVDRIVGFCRGLATFPERGMRRDDLLPGLRVIGFERRVTVAFVVTPDAVLIEGVFYGGRNFAKFFEKG